MNRYTSHFFTSVGFLLTLAAAIILFAAAQASAQCTEVVSGLRTALGITQSNQGNIIVSETGTVAPHSGRISIVDPNGPIGNRRTLLDGLPSAINDVGEPSGPAGVFMRGRTLYLAIGIGDGILASGPGVSHGNPTPSSPIFSSILALHFSANVENNTTGFTLTLAHQFALASGQTVTLSNGRHKLTVELIANFPNFTSNEPPPGNVRGSNPFDLVAVGNRLYVTDGGQNTVRKVNISSGAFSTLVTFPNLPNPLFGTIGGPTVEPVPTGIAYSNGKLLVTLFSGFPFPPGVSRVRQVDPSTGADADFITGRKTAIDVIALTSDDNEDGDNDNNQTGDHQDSEDGDTDWLVLQNASPFGPFFPPPGLVLRFETPTSSPTTVAACLIRPTSMTFDEDSSKLYITELGPAPSGGPSRVVSVAIAP
ncbi:MAG: ScyD/ScyE family protein [Pyrinomonadaceae bacterium]